MTDFEVGKNYTVTYKDSESWSDDRQTPWRAETRTVTGECIGTNGITVLIRPQGTGTIHYSILKESIFEVEQTDTQWVKSLVDTLDTVILDPAKHCFREDSPTTACRDCGQTAEKHSGCDCEKEGSNV